LQLAMMSPEPRFYRSDVQKTLRPLFPKFGALVHRLFGQFYAGDNPAPRY
jgi:hypothetical protein